VDVHAGERQGDVGRLHQVAELTVTSEGEVTCGGAVGVARPGDLLSTVGDGDEQLLVGHRNGQLPRTAPSGNDGVWMLR
jgi:hypothetical protein